MQEPRWCICPNALYARRFLEYLRLRRRDAAKISDRPSLHLLQLSSMILFLIQVLAGVFVRPNLRNNGVEPSPFYSIPAALWSICCISSVISRLNLTIEMEKELKERSLHTCQTCGRRASFVVWSCFTSACLNLGGFSRLRLQLAMEILLRPQLRANA